MLNWALTISTKNAPTDLRKTADGLAQRPHASSSYPFKKTGRSEPLIIIGRRPTNSADEANSFCRALCYPDPPISASAFPLVRSAKLRRGGSGRFDHHWREESHMFRTGIVSRI